MQSLNQEKGNSIEEKAINLINQNFKTPIENILFRSSKIGLLVTGLIHHGLTDKQKERVLELETISVKMIGLSEGQQKKLDSYKLKLSEGGTITPNQLKEKEDFEMRLVTPKGLTDNQQIELDTLKAREGAEPELGQGAKTYIKDVWLKHEKAFEEFDITSKYTSKGLQSEEDAITLVSIVDGFMYMKNKTRKILGHLTGECDIYTDFNKTAFELEAKVIDDTKCCWNPKTFMASGMNNLYEWQGRAYLHLYDAEIFRLRYCLVDCPPEVLADEYKKFCFQHGIIDDALPEYQPMIQQFYNNFLYEKSPLYGKSERVKTFSIVRDPDKEALMLKAIELGVEYYKTITLNMID